MNNWLQVRPQQRFISRLEHGPIYNQLARYLRICFVGQDIWRSRRFSPPEPWSHQSEVRTSNANVSSWKDQCAGNIQHSRSNISINLLLLTAGGPLAEPIKRWTAIAAPRTLYSTPNVVSPGISTYCPTKAIFVVP